MYAKHMTISFPSVMSLDFQATPAISYTFQQEKVNMWKLYERF